jgi:pantetheine-phosphate adenylyltransferase
MFTITEYLYSWKVWLIIVLFSIPIGLLLWPLLFPTILSFPWPDTKHPSTNKKVVILAGSFNPPHLGHYAMIKYLAHRHAKVICVVGCNPRKKYDVSPDERANLVRKMMSKYGPDNVEVQVVTTYIWRYGKSRQCRILYRGIRSWEKDGKEEQVLHIQNTWGPLVLGRTWPIPTVYLEGQPEYNYISSTLIRNLLKPGSKRVTTINRQSDISKMVPETIVDETIDLYSR